jgi:hypothetical protein
MDFGSSKGKKLWGQAYCRIAWLLGMGHFEKL